MVMNVQEVPVGLAVSTAAVASLLAVEFFTSADPIRRCYVFFKQLGSHVSRLKEEEEAIFVSTHTYTHTARYTFI